MYFELYRKILEDDFFFFPDKESLWLIRHIKQRRGRGAKRTRRKK